MAALEGLAAGKKVSDSIRVRPYGRSAKIIEALKDAAQHLNESFHAEHLEIVDAAFRKLGLVRTSDKKNEVANAILRSVSGRGDMI